MTRRRHLRLVDPMRPVTRGDCIDGPRPCVQSWCRHHLLAASESCVLDVVENRGRLRLHEIGVLLGLSKERVRQIAVEAARTMEKRLDPNMRGAWSQARSSSDGVTVNVDAVRRSS